MVANRNRGVGSNQYTDQAPSPEDDKQLAARVRRMQQNSVPGRPASAIAEASDRSDAALIGGLSLTVDKHLDDMGISGSADLISEAGLRRSVSEVAASEDAILQRYPDFYGHSVVGAVYWAQRVKHDPALQRRLGTGDPEMIQLHEAYSSVLRDAATNGNLSVDQLSDALDVISQHEGPGTSTGTQDKETQDSRLMHRFAALSAISSRSSDGPSAAQIEEMEMIRGELNRNMVERRIQL